MKTLTLDLKKKILIREYKDIEECSMIKSLRGLMHSNEQKLICKGSELSEETAKGLAIKDDLNGFNEEFVNGFAYLSHHEDVFEYYIEFTALDSFISAIEAQGYYWGENPIGKYERIDFFKASENTPTFTEWRKYESKTFNPAKTLIFEII